MGRAWPRTAAGSRAALCPVQCQHCRAPEPTLLCPETTLAFVRASDSLPTSARMPGLSPPHSETESHRNTQQGWVNPDVMRGAAERRQGHLQAWVSTVLPKMQYPQDAHPSSLLANGLFSPRESRTRLATEVAGSIWRRTTGWPLSQRAPSQPESLDPLAGAEVFLVPGGGEGAGGTLRDTFLPTPTRAEAAAMIQAPPHASLGKEEA